MHREEFLWEMTSLIMDINPAEILSQIEHDNLRQWCIRWQTAAKIALVHAPLSDDSPLPEGCAKCKINFDSMCMLMPLDGYDEGGGAERRANCPLEVGNADKK